MMPSIEKHVEISRRRTGKDYPELYQWMDADPGKKVERHNVARICEYGQLMKALYGDEGTMAGMDVDSKKNYKKPFNFEEAQKKGFTRKTLFETEHMRFSIYMILPGQENPLHRHPLSDEILAFTHGTGECVVGDEVVSVEPGSVLFIPQDVPHAVRNTHKTETLACTVVQSPLPCEHVMCA